MEKNQPLVSIVLPVHNAGNFLHDCLKSLQKQSYARIEIIAIDDNSKDNSFAILKEFTKIDRRLRVYKNKKRYGITVCFNRAIRRAKGTCIAFMDSKDVSTIDRIKRQVQFLTNNPKVVAVGTQTVFVDENNKKIGKIQLPQEHNSIAKSLFSGISMQFETAMINKLLVPKDLLYFKENKYPFVFSEVFVKLLQYGELANLPFTLHHRRQVLDASTRTIRQIPALLKHVTKSFALYDYRPSFRSLFTPTRINTNI